MRNHTPQKLAAAAAAVIVGIQGLSPSMADAASNGAALHWRLEDTGLVILNDNANARRNVVGIESFDMNSDGVVDSILVGPELTPYSGPSPPPLTFFHRQSAHILLGGAVPTSGANLFPGGRPSYIASGWPLSVDLNGDGKRDVYVPDIGPDTPPFPGVPNVIWLSSPTGWTPANMQPSPPVYVHGASAGRAGGEPVIFANITGGETERAPFLYIFRNNAVVMDRSRLPSLVTGRSWTGSAIADLDSDGIDDLILGGFAAQTPNDPLNGNYVVYGRGDGWQSGTVLLLPHPAGIALSTMTALSVRVADIDGDGRKDLIVGYTAFYQTRGIQVLRNNGDRTFTDISAAVLGSEGYLPGTPSGNLHLVDINGDGCIDLVEPEASLLGANYQLGRIFLNDCTGRLIKANGALSEVLEQLPMGQNLLPFFDHAGRISFYAPVHEPPSPTSNGLAGTRYKRLTNIRNLPTPVNGEIVLANATALWWDPAESGWGVNLAQQGGLMFGTLFTYDAAGTPMWLVMSAGRLQNDGATFAGDLYRTTGPAFNASPFTPIGTANVTRVGSMSFAYSGPDTGSLAYTYDGIAVAKSVRRQVFGSRSAVCVSATASRAALTNYQDLWWNSAESGWGLNITHQDSTVFATLFTYESTGRGIWLVMSSGQRQADGSYSGDLFRTSGPAFNAIPFSGIVASNVGTMRLQFTDGNTGMLSYTFDGISVTKGITRQVFSSSVLNCVQNRL